jgi:hypothetical protein
MCTGVVGEHGAQERKTGAPSFGKRCSGREEKDEVGLHLGQDPRGEADFFSPHQP